MPLAMSTPLHAASTAGEFEIKAAFLHSFPSFVDWPAEALPPGNGPIVVGLVGNDPFGGSLDDLIRGKAGEGRPIVVRRLAWNESHTGCHLLFISASELTHLTQILQSLGTASVLTVADFDHFAARGGMIELRMVDGHVRFDINAAAAGSARLRLSAKLLGLARTVKESNP
jgi:hypothetical protein